MAARFHQAIIVENIKIRFTKGLYVFMVFIKLLRVKLISDPSFLCACALEKSECSFIHFLRLEVKRYFLLLHKKTAQYVF